MSDRRSQGRPCRGESEVGKEKILLALRALLRSDRCHDLSRKAVALHAGVTPALISYYFTSKEHLLLEAVRPIVTVYADEICFVADLSASVDVKMKQIIAILLRLYKDDGKIIDLYRDVGRNPTEAPDQIARITSALARVFNPDGSGDTTEPHLDALILQGAIWGMCRFAAQVEHDATLGEVGRRLDRLPKRLADTMMSIVDRAPSLSEIYPMPSFGIPG